MKTTRDWATELAEEMDEKDFGGLEIIPVIESVLKRYRVEVLEEAAKLGEELAEDLVEKGIPSHEAKITNEIAGFVKALVLDIRELKEKS